MLIRELFFPMGFIKVGRVFSLLSQVALQGLHQAGVTVDLYGRYIHIYIYMPRGISVIYYIM